ncbi:MAG TPA: CGNR zinc finger domain-containing protein [Thermoleophilaceae bacterium]|nr:CGNR zinc finger domain-containing protein [Thermoleophilaceae bacterium]
MSPETSLPKRAPEPLELLQRFVNSVELDTGLEELSSPGELRDWLANRGLMGAGEPVTEGDLRRAIDVREGLRALMLANNRGELDAAAVERMNRAASRAGLRLEIVGDEPRLAPDATGVDGAIARLMALLATAVSDGSWGRLKACSSDGCFWAFYDRSKNRSGRWCSMEVCGNQEKARNYRERHREHSAAR